MIRRNQTSNYELSNARPGGESDEDNSDDDDYYCMGGFSNIKTKTAVSYNLSANNGATDESWEDAADDNASVRSETTPTPSMTIRHACTVGNLEVLEQQLASEPKYNINDFFPDTDETPLITACRNAQLKVVEYLIDEQKADPNRRHPFKKHTPLMLVVGYCNWQEEENNKEENLIKCAEILVKAGADVNLQDQFGMSALMTAAKEERRQLAKYLLENGADPNLTDNEGCSALFYAVRKGDGRMCRRLLEHGADINIEDNHGWCVPELAQDIDFLQLSALLFYVKDTKWKPGLNPELMQQFDEEAAAGRKACADAQSIWEDSAVLMVLQAVDGDKYLTNFRKHKISYARLLTLNEEHLKEIGVDNVGIRERLLEYIQKAHNFQWQEGSIRNIASNKHVTAAEAVCMVTNIKNHMDLVASCLNYVGKRIQQTPESLRYDVERNRIDDLMKFCEQLEESVRLVRHRTLELHTIIGEVQGYNELQIVGRIPKRSFHRKGMDGRANSKFSWKLAGKFVSGVGVLVGCLYCVIKYKRTSI